MEKAWVKKNGFTMHCDGYSGKCDYVDKFEQKLDQKFEEKSKQKFEQNNSEV